MNEIKNTEISLKDTIDYEWINDSYGNTEFLICPVFKGLNMSDVYISTRQGYVFKHYHLNLLKEIPDNKITSFNLENTSDSWSFPKIWVYRWCRTHRALSVKFFVPNNTHMVSFEFSFGDTLMIRFGN